MKRNPDESKLLDAVLADESWQSCSARLQDDALGVLRAAKKSRARWATAAQLTALLTVLAATWWTVRGPREVPGSPHAEPKIASLNSTPVALPSGTTGDRALYITEEQMLALFPKDSCVVAEVNGQQQLVFLDTAR